MAENVTKLHVNKPADKQENTAKVFKPEPVRLTLNDTAYTLVYDLNSFCEMEKMYDSVDEVIQMLLGRGAATSATVTYCGAPALPDDILVDGKPLTEYIAEATKTRKVKHADTLKLLWLGILHDHGSFDEDGNLIGCDVSKAELGHAITFSNLREVNAKIITAILRDLIPAVVPPDEKNVQAPEATQEAQE